LPEHYSNPYWENTFCRDFFYPGVFIEFNFYFALELFYEF